MTIDNALDHRPLNLSPLDKCEGLAFLLLQILHPLVAAGLATYGGLLTNARERLLHTAAAVSAIQRGNQAVAKHVRSTHAGVTGTLQTKAGRWSEGTKFRATDPQLLLWVHATMVEMGIKALAVKCGTSRLSSERKSWYYEQSKPVALAMGVPADRLPADYGALHRYYRTSIASLGRPTGILAITPAAQTIAEALWKIPLRNVCPESVKIAVTAFLPAKARQAYRLPWTEHEQRLWSTMRSAFKAPP